MATALEYFRMFAPEFASVDDATVQMWLDMADTQIAVDCLDDERKAQAQAYYAAHLLWLANTQGSGTGGTGAIRSEREGDLSRSYGGVSGDNTWLGQSGYGQAYWNLARICIGPAIRTRFG